MNPAHAAHGRRELVKEWKKLIEKALSRAFATYHNNAHSTPMFAKRMLQLKACLDTFSTPFVTLVSLVSKL
jgi:hypothetical protein